MLLSLLWFGSIDDVDDDNVDDVDTCCAVSGSGSSSCSRGSSIFGSRRDRDGSGSSEGSSDSTDSSIFLCSFFLTLPFPTKDASKDADDSDPASDADASDACNSSS